MKVTLLQYLRDEKYTFSYIITPQKANSTSREDSEITLGVQLIHKVAHFSMVSFSNATCGIVIVAAFFNCQCIGCRYSKYQLEFRQQVVELCSLKNLLCYGMIVSHQRIPYLTLNFQNLLAMV